MLFLPPKRAGPIDRAGFTDVPIVGMIICIITKASPMASPAANGLVFTPSVMPNTTKTNMPKKLATIAGNTETDSAYPLALVCVT